MTRAASLEDAARAWIAQDPDADTRAELTALLDAAATDPAAATDLAGRFSGRLEFGTAGLRGALGAGPMRMNRVLVAQAAAGLGRYLVAREERPSAVIGYDGRRNSRVFAEDSAEILAGLGVRVRLLPRPLPTPVLAFAVVELDASAGVMVTASHNPAADNGYKVYLGGADRGSQIVPPADVEIAARIAEVAAGNVADLPRSTDYAVADDAVVDAYVRRTAELGRHPGALRVVYTPLHGVGRETFERVLEAAGYGPVIVVDEQADPDPDFPTVAFPNPEEKGAMDLAFGLAADLEADLVIAHDPDADRVAVGVVDRLAGHWRRLSGNEVGWLLGWEAARRAAGHGGGDRSGTAADSGADPGSGATAGSLANSLVSSPALGAVAARYGLRHVETLTGFKWISRAPGLVYGYEEALGYLVDPDKVRDKDGISAAIAILSLASELAARGATLGDRLLEFAEEFGGHASDQLSIRVDDVADIGRMMGRLRSAPPGEIGGIPVIEVDDFLDGVESFAPSDILRFRLADDGRVLVRPSGTEPKLKCYIDAVVTTGTASERLVAARTVVARIAAGMRGILGATR